MAFAKPEDTLENSNGSSDMKYEDNLVAGETITHSEMDTAELSNADDIVQKDSDVNDENSDGEKVIEKIPVDSLDAEADPELVKKRKLDEMEPESTENDSETIPSKKPHLDSEVKRLLPDLEKFWNTVDQDPNDFTAWTHLLQYVDQVTHMSVAGEAYDAFLTKYPYCYGYWKKYADFAKRRGSALEVQQIFIRGLKAIPLSVDLWIHYLTYVKSTRQDDEEMIRSKYDLGIESCGLEFRSDKLWEQYVQWEIENNNLKNAMKIWDQIIKTPTQALKKHFDKLVEFVNEHEPVDFLTESDYSALSAGIGEESGDENEQDDIASKLRSKIIELRTEVYENTCNEVKIRSSYEDGIKRPYFHVKPVEKNQLKNWTDYLDFEIGKGELKRIITLFERCLIACAMYAEYWDKYLQFLRSQSPLDVSKIEEVYTRVATVHHPKILQFALDFAAFEEIQGNLEKASEIYEDLISSETSPQLPAYYRHIHFERRRRNLSKCCELYEKYIKGCGDKVLSVHLTIKYARFLSQSLESYAKAIDVLKVVIETDFNATSKVLMALVELGMQTTPLDFESVLFAFDYGIKHLGKNEKLVFAQRKLEFLEDYGEDMKIVQNADEELQSLSKVTKEEEKTEMVTNSVKVSNSEVVKVAPISVESQPPSGYDYNNSSSYSPQYGQYAQGQGQGQYSGSWNSQPPAAASEPSVYGQSYVNQPSSWNSFYA